MSKKKKKPLEAPAPAPKNAFELPDGHHCWPSTGGHFTNGIEKRGDRIYLSPGRIDPMRQLADQAEGVNQLVDSVSAFAAKQLAVIQQARRRWWSLAIEDLGMTRSDPEFGRLMVNWDSGYVTLKPEEEKPDKPE